MVLILFIIYVTSWAMAAGLFLFRFCLMPCSYVCSVLSGFVHVSLRAWGGAGHLTYHLVICSRFRLLFFSLSEVDCDMSLRHILNVVYYSLFFLKPIA